MPLENFFVQPTHPAFYVKDDKFQLFITRVSSKAKLSGRQYLKELILTQYEQKFSDPMVPEFIVNLQQKFVRKHKIVVTRNVSGSINKIPYLEVWTWQYLFDKGIDLSKSPIGSKQIMRDIRKLMEHTPLFTKVCYRATT